MPNGINSISPTIRDFLLNRNLILSDTITANGLSAMGNGLGFPAQISNYPESVLPSQDIVSNGNLYRELNQINNPYSPVSGNELIDIVNSPLVGNLPPNTPQIEYPTLVGSDTANSPFTLYNDNARLQLLKNRYQPNEGNQEMVSIEYTSPIFENRSGGYIDNNNNLNFGGPSTNPIDLFSDLTSFDIRSSLGGRVLGATGGVNDTPLGVIGRNQLIEALKYKVAFNTRRETLGQLNLNPISLISGNDIIVPNYSITVGKTSGRKFGDVALNILGIESPTSYLFDVTSSIFAVENPVSTKERIDSQVQNTGKGQIINMFLNLNANKYRLGYSDSRINNGNGGVNQNMYIFDDGRGGVFDNSSENITSSSNHEFNGRVEAAGFESLIGKKIGQSDFIWADEKINTDPIKFAAAANAVVNTFGGTNFIQRPNTVFNNTKTMLGKTQALFNTGTMRVLVSGHGSKATRDDETSTYAKVGADFYLSKGSGVLSKEVIDGTNGNSGNDVSSIFCRTWTSFDKYDQVGDLQKHSGLGVNFGLRNRNTTDLSVLDDNGFVRISPNIGDDTLKGDSPVNIKRFMFSLENLAWSGDDYVKLPASERGPGDLVTGTKGRIMWFPPYDLNFTDTTSVNWDSHAFIGRGEPVYTYNNSERSGNLSFKVIIDHASYMNELRGNSNNDLFASIASGCYEFDLDKVKNLTKDEQDKIESEKAVLPDKILDSKQIPPDEFTIYFANDVASINKPNGYEANGDEINPSSGLGITLAEAGYNSVEGRVYEDRTDYGLNKEYLSANFISQLKEHLNTKCPACRVNLGGYASTDGTSGPNQKLSDDRAANVRKWFLDNNIFENDAAPDKRFLKVVGKGTTGCSKDSAPIDALCKKKARKVDVTFTYDPSINEANVKAQVKKDEEEKAQRVKRDLNNNIKSRFFNEALYFEKLAQDNKFIYDSIGEKIKYFHPAFHSITPEGFNARLNFLQQCTRQGATRQGSSPNNLVFGMAPVLILRIGDFYHTKIVVDSLDIDYDSGTGVQWDLNPEGIGVQPMIANVNISFKFIGGQSLNGPINKLQNAVSFNFFANTEVYDPRADYIKINTDTDKRAEYKNDLDKGNLFSILNTNVDGSINEKLSNDQLAVAEIENSTPQSSSSLTNSGSTGVISPKITGIENVIINKSIDSDTSFTVQVFLKQEGIYNGITPIITEDEIKNFISKGLKISLSPLDIFSNKIEEVVSNSASSPKKLEDFFNGGYYMGSINNQGIRINNLSHGEYVLTVTYNGQRVGSLNVNVQ